MAHVKFQFELDLQKRLRAILRNPDSRGLCIGGLITIFCNAGIDPNKASSLSERIIDLMECNSPLDALDRDIYRVLQETNFCVPSSADKRGLYKCRTAAALLAEQKASRSDVIAAAIAESLRGTEGALLDVGGGDGTFAAKVQRATGLRATSLDSAAKAAPEVDVKFVSGDAVKLDDHFAPRSQNAVTAVNVLHHIPDVDAAVASISTVAKDRLAIVEGCLDTLDEETLRLSRTTRQSCEDAFFFLDYLTTRALRGLTGIPVPGTFGTPDQWVRRFEQHGWRCEGVKSIGGAADRGHNLSLMSFSR